MKDEIRKQIKISHVYFSIVGDVGATRTTPPYSKSLATLLILTFW